MILSARAGFGFLLVMFFGFRPVFFWLALLGLLPSVGFWLLLTLVFCWRLLSVDLCLCMSLLCSLSLFLFLLLLFFSKSVIM